MIIPIPDVSSVRNSMTERIGNAYRVRLDLLNAGKKVSSLPHQLSPKYFQVVETEDKFWWRVREQCFLSLKNEDLRGR